MYLRKCFRRSVSEQVCPNRTPHLKTLRVLRCVVVTSDLFLHPCWHGVGTFSLYLEPCWHVALRCFLTCLNAPKFASELHQYGPTWLQDGPKTATRRPKSAQDGPKTATRQPKSAKDGPKIATRLPKLAQHGPQDAPRQLNQDGPKMAPRRPKDRPNQPKMA